MKEFFYLLPELLLALTLAFIVVGEITYHGEKVRLISITAILGLASAFIQAFINFSNGSALVFGNTLAVDGLSFFFRTFFIVLTALSIVVVVQTKEIEENKRAECFALMIGVSLAACIAASAVNLLLIFLALMMVNLLAGLLAGFSKRVAVSNEASFKHLVFSVVASGFVAYGFALAFSTTKVLNLYEIHKVLLEGALGYKVALAIFILTFLGLMFQMGAFPMHFWVPDVLQGAPTPISAFLVLAQRAVGFVVGIRIFFEIFSQPALTQGKWSVLGPFDWTQVLALSAGVSMLIGALLALRQESAKRMIAALIVAQTGHFLLGFLVLDSVGISALLYNWVVELFAVVGGYFVLAVLIEGGGGDRLENLKGMLARAPTESISLILFLMALVGIPPMPGFLGKFTLIGAVMRQGQVFLGGISIISIAISWVVVSRLAFAIVGDFRKNREPALESKYTRQVFLVVLVAPLLLTTISSQWIFNWTAYAISKILW